ncbi:hypothetical protein L1I30_08670 [Gillisia sp. M10.2A]|uniref:Secreted protein n=1 Tax=Gillisia lutea TaxID=2909668 RepID=A0ABS9EFU7_9FLAO|nr:hypothetical protein [Gillisia lutea]MCF4101736.1 hypothetical protein [Gillisia lutea]
MNIFQKYGLILMAVALLFPAAVSIHIFAHEKHSVCTDYSSTHLHKSSIDCELCKFHPVPIIAIDLFNYNIVRDIIIKESSSNHYEFLSDFQKLPFSLRGPPSSIIA